MCVYKYSITLCVISVYLERDQILLISLQCPVSRVMQDIGSRMRSSIFNICFRPSICCRGMGGYTTILYGSWSEAGATWFGSVTDLQPRGWERGAGRPIGLEQQGKTLIQFSLSSHGEWKVPKTKKMNSRVVKKLPQKPLWIMKIWTWRPKLCDLVQYLYICILHLVISNIE